MPKYEFTMVSDPMLRGLREAGATSSEIIAYLMLVRTLPKDRSRIKCWMPADKAEEKTGMSPHTFSKALRGLTNKTFKVTGGAELTVLSQISRGCRGHCPHFTDNLGWAISEGTYPADGDSGNGDPNRHPIRGRNGDPKQDPITEFSTSEWGPETNEMGTQNEPVGDPAGHPIRLDKTNSKDLVDTASPPAKRSGVVSQPHKKNSDTLSLVTGDAIARAAAAALGGAAPALPTLEEYRRVERKLEDEGLEALTASDRRTYHEGHAAYAAMMA